MLNDELAVAQKVSVRMHVQKGKLGLRLTAEDFGRNLHFTLRAMRSSPGHFRKGKSHEEIISF